MIRASDATIFLAVVEDYLLCDRDRAKMLLERAEGIAEFYKIHPGSSGGVELFMDCLIQEIRK